MSPKTDIFVNYDIPLVDNQTLSEGSVNAHVGYTISQNKDYFDDLILFTDILSISFDSASKSLWDVLMLVPTQPDLLESVVTFAKLGNTSFKTLFTSSPGKLLLIYI